MISGHRHPNPRVAAELRKHKKTSHYVPEHDQNGHRWGWLHCLGCGKKYRVHGTPESGDTEAKKIAKFVRQHETTCW
ncbi:hypothetical protein ACFV27_38665 [Streptomyces antimycoticus]|uniref:hypothetical protein n=1 Tax=Streptomyces TaxID=1883 RepID=UPI003686E0A7